MTDHTDTSDLPEVDLNTAAGTSTVTEEDVKHRGSKMLDVHVELSRAQAEIQPPRVKVTW